jgi:sulfite reductase (NADPH) flavoprotein alpha-component
MFWWNPPRVVSALLVMVAYAGICLHIWRSHRKQAQPSSCLDADTLLIGYASQGGQAQELAERSAGQLREAGLDVDVRSLNAIEPASLSQQSRALFIVSTYGEGEAPDNAARFEQRVLRSELDLSRTAFALLALGDRQYSQFCGFARHLDSQLQHRGARPLFDRLEADRCDPAVLRQWQQQLGLLVGKRGFSDWQAPAYQSWRLAVRRCLNPGSQGRPAFHLQLHPPTDASPRWQAGDIAEIGPCHTTERVEALLNACQLNGEQILGDGQTLAWQLARRQLPDDPQPLCGLDADTLLQTLPRLSHRDYSIASLPTDGTLDLLVRLQQDASGRPGLGSGWLCQHAPLGTTIDLRIRANPAFRLAADSGPLILIGNGTGLAGLRAHLRERMQLGQHGHWLLFGERNADRDLFFESELSDWQRSGHLARLDLAFSRDQAQPVYVQHLLRDAADELRSWIEGGASLLVCGSLKGMGEDVDALLHGLLGQRQIAALREAGRYRRDLY